MLRSLRLPALVLTAALTTVGAAQAGTASAQGPAQGPAAPARGAFAAAEAVDRPVAAVVAARAAQAARAAEAAEAARRSAEEAQRAAAESAAREAESAARASLCSGEGWQQRRGEAALASLGPRALDSGWRVELSGARSGYLGLAHLQRRVVEVFVRGCDAQSDELLRHVMAHELGHALDTERLTAADRAAWKAARGIPASTDWYGCSGCTDFATPAGDFAEVYAQWLRGAPANRSELAGSPGPAELEALAARFFG